MIGVADVVQRWLPRALVGVVLAVAAPVWGQDDPTGEDQAVTRPASAGRVVRHFDFEERVDTTREDFNPEAVPRHWVRAQHDPPGRDRPGFPLSNKAGYDTSMAHQGQVSVRLPTAGGSSSLRLSGTLLPIFPGADYLVTAFVRTEGLEHARAFVMAQFLDAAGKVITGSTRKSSPMLSPGAWAPVRLELPGVFDQAAYVQVELLLLQPAQFTDRPRTGRFHAWPQDFAGSAWFDDIGVLQLPRVTINTPNLTNVYVSEDAPPAPLLTAVVQDLAGEETQARLTLYDLRDQLVDTTTRTLGAGGGQIGWNPPLPGPGFYRAQLDVLSGGVTIGRSGTQFVWMKPREHLAALGVPAASPAHARRFGVTVGPLEDWQRRLVPELLAATGAGAATLTIPPIGDARPEAASERADYHTLLDALLAKGFDLTVALRGVDPKLAHEQQTDPGDPLMLLARDEAAWLPSLRGMLDQYGQRIRRWQVGADDNAETVWRSDLAPALRRFREVLGRMVPGPMLTIPWRGDWGWPDAATGPDAPVRTAAVIFPSSFPVSAVRPTADVWSNSAGGDVRERTAVIIESPDAAVYGHEAALIETLQRAVAWWATLGPGDERVDAPSAQLLLPQPWRDAGQSGLQRQVLPEATLAAWRALVDHVAGRRVVGTLPAGPGVRCYILSDIRPAPGVRRTGALVLWSDAPSPNGLPSQLTAPLGLGRIVRFDAFGNSQELKPLTASGLYQIPVEPMPVFIEGIESELVLLLQGLRVDPPFVPAIAAEHQRRLIVPNPWPVRITGEIQFLPPETAASRTSWRFAPTAPVPFSIAPGESAVLPFAFSFGSSEESGEKELRMIIRLNTDRPYPAMRVSTPINIGLADLDLSPNVVPAPGPTGPDLAVIASVANTGTVPRTLRMNVQAPGRAIMEQPVSNLAPGESTVRRFILPNAAAELSGKRIRVSVVDIDGADRLNKSVVAP